MQRVELSLRLAALAAAAVLTLVTVQHWRGASHIADRVIADQTYNLAGTPVREHCLTCHTNGGREGNADHPDIAPHRIEQLGCTGCHLGEGMALDAAISHGLPGQGARQLLTGRELQASCFTCHEVAPLAGARDAWNGYRRFYASACDLCHRIDLHGTGGRYGPDLHQAGSFWGLEALQTAIRDPRREPANSIMPRFPLSSGQVRQLGDFLKSRVARPFHLTPMRQQVAAPLPLPEEVAQAPDPLRRHRCLACHRFGAEDGRVSTDLSYSARQRDDDYLRAFLRRPQRLVPDAMMPVILLPEAEVAAVLDRLHQPVPAVHGDGSPRALYMAYCQRCHAAEGDGHGPIQPNLAGFPRAFRNNADYFRRQGRDRAARRLEKGVPGTSMPPYGALLSVAQRKAVMGLVYSAFVGDTPPAEPAAVALPPQTEPLSRPEAGRLFANRCARCHGNAGAGKGPEADRYLPRPRNLLNPRYFNVLGDDDIARSLVAGVPGTAMPAFGDSLSPAQLWCLVERVRQLAEAGDV